MWILGLILSVSALIGAGIISVAVNSSNYVKKHKFSLFYALFAAVVVASFLMLFPVNLASEKLSLWGACKAFLLSAFHTMQVMTAGCEFSVVTDAIVHCDSEELAMAYQIWATVLYVLAPVFSFGFVLSLFKNMTANAKYRGAYFRDVYVFSELNEKSLILASDVKKHHKKAAIVFTDVFEGNEESTFELMEEAKKLRAICFKSDILAVNFQKHSEKTSISFFTIGVNETENINQSIKLIERYKNRDKTHVYVFSTKAESEILLSAADKGQVKVRRINEVVSLINRTLYEHGEILFESAVPNDEGSKDISAVVVGMGRHGTEMVKALAWFGQMDGYRLEIHAFDRDPLAQEKFVALAPELMSEQYNGVAVEGEAQYRIFVHPDMDVDTVSFAKKISEIKNATYVLVALGDDDVNIRTAINLRMYFERIKAKPVIQAIVYNSRQKNAMQGVKNFKGQEYRIDFIGDLESSFTEDVIIDSALEEEALERHLKWGKEEEFWKYEYNYRSSVASAIHMRARIRCGIPGADKKEEELTEQEREMLETLEHKRWNAYMRAEGYVFSGSKDKSSRNDLAKMHHDLVTYDALSDEEKRKDSAIGAK